MRTALQLVLASAFLIAAGPESSSLKDGTEITTRVRKVTVYSDRARILRAGSVAMKDGRQRILVSGLPVGIEDASVSAALPGKHGARILSIEVEESFGKRANKKEAEALLEKYRGLERKDRVFNDELAALAAEDAFLRSMAVKVRTDEKGKPQSIPLEPSSWQATLSFVSDSLASVLSRTRTKQAEQRALAKEMAALSVEIAKVRSYESESAKRVALEVEGTKTESVDIEVTYSIAGPGWRPAYDVRVLSSQGKVEVVTHGVVRQATGEDWKDVELVLSTAFPETGADIPELLAWRLGDATQYAVAAASGGVGSMAPGTAVARAPASPKPSVSSKESDDRPGRRASGKSKAGKKVAEAPAEESVAPEPSPEYYADEAEDYSYDGDGGPMGGEGQGYGVASGVAVLSTPPTIDTTTTRNFKATVRPPPPPVIRQVNPSVWSLPAGHSFTFQNHGGTFTWSGDLLYCPSPRVSAGGFDYSYKVAGKQSVLADGRERKLKLTTSSFPAALRYEVVAPLSTKAFLRASVKNDTRQPFLAGESFVFLDEDFVGRAFLNTVAASETLELSLGVDDDVKVERRLEQSAETKGLVSKKDRTVYTVLVNLKNFKKRPIEVVLRDQIPITWQKDDISVETVSISPEPLPTKEEGTDKDQGLLAWKLSIPAGARSDLKIKYVVERPRDFDLVESRR